MRLGMRWLVVVIISLGSVLCTGTARAQDERVMVRVDGPQLWRKS